MGVAVRRVEPLFVRLAIVVLPVIISLAIAPFVRGRSFVATKPPPSSVAMPWVVTSNARPTNVPARPPETQAEDVSPPVWDPGLMVAAPFARVLVDLHSDPNFPLAELLAPELSARTAREVSPRKLRELMDRGVVGYASAKTRDQKIRAAKLIGLAANLGYGPARDLVARNYQRSEAMQSVVPAVDAIRYIFALVTTEGSTAEDADAVFLALVEHAAASGTMDRLAKQLAEELRTDRRAHLNHRIDLILGLLARVPGACAAIVRIVASGSEQPQDECSSSLNQSLSRFAQSSADPRVGRTGSADGPSSSDETKK